MVDLAQSPLLFFRAAVVAGALAALFLPLAASVAAAAAEPRFEPPPFAIATVDGCGAESLGAKQWRHSAWKKMGKQGRRREQMASKKILPAPSSLFTTDRKNDPNRQNKSIRSARNLAIHVAATESNRRRPLSPLRTGIQETIITHRENRARTVKSSPRGVIPGQLCINGPTQQCCVPSVLPSTPPLVRRWQSQHTSLLTLFPLAQLA